MGLDQRLYCPACVPEAPPLADLGTRFAANLLDNFALMIPLFVTALGAALVGESGEGAILVALLGFGTLGSLAVLAVQLYLCAAYSQSIAKRLLGIKVVRADGSPASFARILFLRNVIPQAIGSMCSPFSLVDALFIFGNQRRCLHDHMADTIVVKVWPGGRSAPRQSPAQPPFREF